MIRLVDVVNFNADASCLSAAEWLAILEGGNESRLCRWLRLYVDLRRPVVLGFVGGAVADMATFNPEAIGLVNDHPEIFELLPRPFSHDVGLLRSTQGFLLNLRLGRQVVRREFRHVVEVFLPPEFMLTNAQVKLLADAGLAGVFLNPERFKEEVRLPNVPFVLEGVLGSRLPCFPFAGALTQSYLDALHVFEATPWLAALEAAGERRVFCWRDGESSFLLPDGVERERSWLAGETESVWRESLSSVLATLRPLSSKDLPAGLMRNYPVHSFTAWFKEFRMLGFLHRLEAIEARLESLPADLRVVWLQAINSDVLSAVEKQSPVVTLLPCPGSRGELLRHTIWRSARGFEGEDYLAVLEAALASAEASSVVLEYVWDSQEAHLRKLRARVEYVRGLEAARSV